MQIVKLYRRFMGVMCLFLVVSNGVARSLDDIKDSGAIRIAVYNDYAPFSFVDNGVPRGIDVDIANAIAKSLNVKLALIWMTPGETAEDDFRNYLWKGHIIHRIKADVMMRAPYDPSFSQKRDDVGLLVNELVHMFAPYHRESWQILHNTETLPEVETMGMFQYHTIGAEIDSIPHFYLISAFGGRLRNNTSHYASNGKAIEALEAGKVEAVMGLRSQMSYLSQFVDGNKFQLASNAFPLIGKQKWDIGLAIHTNFRALGYEIGDVITRLVEEGEMAKIFDNYNTTYEKPPYYSAQ
ncbi:ABC transporter substrate-binding protein [Aestuariibacter sp. A3R04]|uniref:substrate-binding periplasmic protein n=1 Tax=Aestuariibacter sp. A3R04 TaxID=2841571 RepID=UPI001C09CA0D|nr:ABC transporter substrate-binding protein [Aestuariibacter sp. A3R04]